MPRFVAILALFGLLACDPDDPCDPRQVHVQGACVAAVDAGSDGGGDAGTDAATEDDAG